MQRLIPVLKQDGVDTDLIMLIRTLLAASKEIAFRVSQGALAGILGSTLNENIQGEVQKKLDVVANQLIKDMLLTESTVAAIASEEEEQVVAGDPNGQFIVAFDPLDGSSNIDVNGQIGTIFTIYPRLADLPHDDPAQFLQAGRAQLCAGYVLYGPASMLVMTTGGPTRCYTLDLTHGGFLLTQERLTVSQDSQEFAVNLANYRYWQDDTRAFFHGVMEKDKSLLNASVRWNAAMVSDVHRILNRGGLFCYPADSRKTNQQGKIRLLYEANPLAWLVQQAGGAATANGQPILCVEPTELHQRVPVCMGSINQVNAYDGMLERGAYE